MKKKVLSLLLAVCLVVGMLPLAASAAEGDAFKVGEVTFSTLKDAVEAAGAEGTVEAIGVYTVTTEDATALAGAKTTDVVVKNGASVTVSEDALASLLTYSGKITVEAGGALTLPEKSGGMEPWFGGKDARMNITAGSVIISQLNKATEGGCVWSLSEDAVVEVPAAQEAFLHVNNFGVKLDIPEGANLVVNGTLRAISGTKPSTLFIRGTVTVNKDATMTVAEKATAEIGATGALNVKAESNFTVAENGTSNNITLEQGGVFSAPSSVDTTNWLAVDDAVSSTLVKFTDENGNVVYGSRPTSESNKTYYLTEENGSVIGAYDDLATLIAAVDGTKDVKAVLNGTDDTLSAETVLPANLTLVVGTGKTLTVSAKLTLGHSGGLAVFGKVQCDKENIVGTDDTSKIVMQGEFKTADDVSDVFTEKTNYVWSTKQNDGTDDPKKGAWKTETEDLVITAEYWKANVEATKPADGDTYAPTWEALRNLTFYNSIVYNALNSNPTYKERVTAVNTFITTTLTKLNMSGKNITEEYPTDDTGILEAYTGLTWLNLSNTGITEVGGLQGLTSLTYLDISGNPEIKCEEGADDTVPLQGLTKLETLNISGTGISVLDFLWDSSAKTARFAVLKTLKAQNLELTSIAALVEIVSKDDFDPKGITWDLTGSELTNTEMNKGHVAAVEKAFTDGGFSKPTIPGGSTGGGGGTGSTSYTVTVSATQNGTVTASPSSANKGDKVTLTVAPAEGYELGTLTAKDAKGNTVALTKVSDTEYTFVMPEGNVTVSATFVEKNATPFTDVKTADWWYEAVKYVYENKLMAGTSTTTFEPTAKLNRAQAVQILYNLEGQPAVTGTADFTDVSGHWALNAITWGAENNVVAGVGNGKFDPNADVTREQFAQMMYNYAKFKGYDLSAAGDLNSFSDVSKVSDWAKAALTWANGEGLINGNEDGTLAPNGTAIRGQAASILMNFDQNVVK